jgi:hypothetical protein
MPIVTTIVVVLGRRRVSGAHLDDVCNGVKAGNTLIERNVSA